MSDLVKFTTQRIGDNSQLQLFVQQARQVANVIFPETLPFSNKYNKLGAEVVTIDPSNERHVYKNESGTLCLHLSKINEIAKAAKIRVTDSRILERKTDTDGRVTFISHQVTVQYRIVTGEMITESYTGKYDYFNDLATKSEGQTKSRRKHAEALAESNALYRAFNKVLPQLPGSFKRDELTKPFLIPYVEEDTNSLLEEFDPEERREIKKQMARQKLLNMGKIYDEPTLPKPVPTPQNVEDAKVISPEPVPVHQVLQQSESTPTNKDLSEEYRNSPQEARSKKILELVKQTGYKDPRGAEITNSRISKMSVGDQIRFIEILFDALDSINSQDDLPF